ncbi:hypothetical protein TPHA_0A00520 [Tetrapisispora phaffii CBS 4417]|uniref:Transcription activator GCR1-like domain-containing protein n=1 Tax=Tetrapisispora phaffii (strain ATCC 24235 / CBS 4417 / NBRC 1672 / NRRL Y-8282 / UCD 70-5) TaxID=1071381 RepID=G8BMK9_TETPH|nr:hypothetical protein TPHA_0A00520 [Tetrapisispora phaffii CBS 4417]CCE61137.1 hypothetical protein TPHA_0A00520 [Tetrapisispora phaffii CBS 4417]
MYGEMTSTLSDDVNFHFKRVDNLVNSQQNQINDLNNLIMTLIGHDNLPASREHNFTPISNHNTNTSAGAKHARGMNVIKLPSPNYLTPVQTAVMSTSDSVLMNNIDTISRSSTGNTAPAITPIPSNSNYKSNFSSISHTHQLPDPISKINSNPHTLSSSNTPMFKSCSIGTTSLSMANINEVGSVPISATSSTSALTYNQTSRNNYNAHYQHGSSATSRNHSVTNLNTKNGKMVQYGAATTAKNEYHGLNNSQPLTGGHNSHTGTSSGVSSILSPVSLPMENGISSVSLLNHNSMHNISTLNSSPVDMMSSISMDKTNRKIRDLDSNTQTDAHSLSPVHSSRRSKFIINPKSKRRKSIFRGTFEFVKSPQNVIDIWNEYTKGYNGQPSIKEMEEIHKTTWRRDPAVNKRYARRKVLWRAIETGLKKGFTLEATIQMLEDHRYTDRAQGTKEPIGWLCQINSIPEVLRR